MHPRVSTGDGVARNGGSMWGGQVLNWPAVRYLQDVLGRVRAPRWIVWSAAVVLAAMCWAAPGEALATNYTVIVVGDQADLVPGNGLCDVSPAPGEQCTLRAAIQELNDQGGGPHTITLPPGPYTLTLTGDDDTAAAGDLDITANITIAGFFAPATFIQACDAVSDPTCTGIDRVFDIRPGGSLTMNGVTVRKGNVSGANGGGILVDDGGAVTLTNTVLEENRTSSFGGGLRVGPAATATLTNVTLRNNHAGFNGGGIESFSSQLTMTNVTISGNTALSGGGLLQEGAGSASATLTNVTITENAVSNPSSAAGIDTAAGTITLRNSLVARNTGPGDVSRNCRTLSGSTFASQGFNLVFPGDGCGFSAATNDLINADPKLGPLQANGIQVPTHALFPGSAAIDAGNPSTPGSGGTACPATDPRGIARTANGDLVPGDRCDIGAHEVPVFTVDSTTDADDASPGNAVCATSAPAQCTLRAAIREANALGAGSIRLPGGDYTLTVAGTGEDEAETGDLDITGGLTIARTTAGPAFIQACDVEANPNCLGIDRVFHVAGTGSLTLRLVTVRKGRSSSGGGGILQSVGSTLVLSNSVLDGNRSTSDEGGGLKTAGTATLTNVSIVNNSATDGGGIESAGTLNLTNVTISDNEARSGEGGGIRQIGALGSVTLTNVTIADNRASSEGGGLHLVSGGTVTLRNSIVARNTVGIPGPAQCSGAGAYVSQGFNLVFPLTGCGLSAGASDVLDADPRLGPLAFNGSQTLTRPLLVGSAAIDAGNPAAPLDGQGGRCAEKDQDGESRRDGNNDGIARCDIGAFELRTLLPIDLAVTLTDGVSTVAPGGNLTYVLTVTNPSTFVIPDVRVAATVPAPLTNVTWTCAVTGASSCTPASGSGNIAGTATLGTLGSVTYTIQATVPVNAAGGSTVATATISPPGGIADPSASNNTAADTNTISPPTATPPPGPIPTPLVPTACGPRPSVVQPVTPAGPGRVQVALAPSTNAGQATNRIQAVRLGTLQNAIVDVPAQPDVPAQNGLGSGASIALSGPVTSLQVFVRRASSQPAAFTAPMTVTDGCGAWPTFAGGGAGLP